jgi:hypothetical protein
VGGNVYRWNEHDLEGCLCPALLRYFDSAPKELWVQLKQDLWSASANFIWKAKITMLPESHMWLAFQQAKISQFQADC